MQPPERPSRHRSHDKWKRIIEPAGDSDSSEWSSDSDMSIGMNPFRNYRSFDLATLPNGSSSSNANREQQSPVSASSQSIQSREPSAILRTLESCSYMFDPAVRPKRYEDLDIGTGTSANHFNHLLHHDYAEREVNNDRSSTGDPLWSHHSKYTTFIGLGRKGQRLKNNSVSVTDSSKTTNTSSTSSCGLASASISSSGLTSATAPVEGVMQDPDTGSALTSIIGPNQEGVDGWRIMSNMERLNSSSRKRSLFMPSDSTAIGPADASDANEHITTAAPEGAGIDVPGASLQMQTQAGQRDSTVTGTVDARHPLSLIDWYVKKKVQSRCNKRVMFSNNAFRQLSGVPELVPEECGHIQPRTSEDPSEVPSMTGSSNISYAPGTWQMPLVGPEEPVLNESLQTTPGIVEAGQEEVIMVDDVQPESAEKHPSSQPQEYFSAPSCKRSRDDELLNQGLIGLLECPVCMEYMGPPIHQCRRGHLVCSVCKPKLPSCPTCRSRFTEARNLAMEKVADKLYYPCKNAHVGCTDTLRLRNKDEHEANCAYRSYRCIMVPPCEWKGQHHDILPHVMLSHSDTLLEGPEHVLEMRLGDLTEQSSQNWIVSALGELFRVNLSAVRGGRVQVFGCVLLLGPARRAPLFRYTLMVGPVEGDSAQRKLSYSRTTHCYVERCSKYYSAGDSLHLRTESAQLFSSGQPNDRTIYVKLLVEKIGS